MAYTYRVAVLLRGCMISHCSVLYGEVVLLRSGQIRQVSL